MIVLLGDGSTNITHGGAPLSNDASDVVPVVGIMFKFNARSADENNIGVEGCEIKAIQSYDLHIMSTNKRSLEVLRKQVDLAIENFDEIMLKNKEAIK